MEVKAKVMAELLKLLANENRLLILCALMNGQMSVNEILKQVPDITQPALSQHLTLLKTAKILDSKKTGASITYFIADHRVEEILKTVKKHYCDN